MQPHSLAPFSSPTSKIAGILFSLLHQQADVSLASFPFLVHLLTVAGSCFFSALIVSGIIEHPCVVMLFSPSSG